MISSSSNISVLHGTYASLNFGTDAKIIQQIDLIYGLLHNASVPVRPYTEKSVQILMTKDEETKVKILSNLTSWSSILSSAGPLLEPKDERVLAKKALNHFGFMTSPRNWEDIQLDEIIEIYNPEGIQLYRSLNFFKTCGYSLLDLCVNEWFVLWERPQAVIHQMHAVVGEVMSGRKKDYAMNIGPHLIRETYDDGTTQPFSPRAAIVEFKNIYPAYGEGHDGIIGFVVTSKGKLVSTGDDTMKLDFI